MSDQNLYPVEPAGVRRRRRRAPRPAHLPPFDPTAVTSSKAPVLAPRSTPAAPAAATFGAPAGANNALLFHHLRQRTTMLADPPAPTTPTDRLEES